MTAYTKCIALAAAFGIVAGPAMAAVTATPSTITFNNQVQTVSVSFQHNGQPVSPDAIGNARLLVGKGDHTSDYSRMIRVSKTDQGIRVEPTRNLEVGSYDLVVDTRHGPASIRVYAPLADLKSILDEADGPGGPRLGALREELGLSTRTGRASVSIDLPPVFVLGDTLSLSMEHDANREYIWAINGEVVQRGHGASSFEYTFNQTGDFILTYAERRDGATLASAEAITRVTEPPALPYTVPRGTSPPFEGPAGYAEYRWEVNGEVMGTQRTFSKQFDQAGEYLVTLRASDPERGVYAIRYLTTVE